MAANIIAADGMSFGRKGLLWELNPGPLAPEARIIPLDQAASGITMSAVFYECMQAEPDPA